MRIVAHSKGGLIGKLLLVHDTTGRFDRMISINTPCLGSPLAQFGMGPWRGFSPTRPAIVELAEQLEVNSSMVPASTVVARGPLILTLLQIDYSSASLLQSKLYLSSERWSLQ